MPDEVKPQAGAQKLSTPGKSEVPIYILGIFLGICAGLIQAGIDYLLLTALFVLASTMLMGALCTRKPWRWVLVVGVFVPVVQLLAFLVLTVKPYPAQIYESFLGFLTGFAGAYGGAVIRMAIRELFETKP
jgi:hypothetical protein